MQIDWLTVIAQIVNFLILVWLLKRFLYQPVINAMDRREQRIAERLQLAEQREQTAIETRQDYANRIASINKESETLMASARQEAEAERQQLLSAARSEAGEKRSLWQHQVNEEKQRFLRSLKLQASETIQHIVRQALSDLADAELEEQMIESFLRQLESLDNETREEMASTAQPFQVTSSLALKPPVRDRLTGMIHHHIAQDVKVVFNESAALICGIQLTASGRRLGWNLADYLSDMEQRVQVQLETINAAGE
jgi:F-type H+-transporting ATPase subunit b